MSPFEHVRLELATARAAGESFDAVWWSAIAGLPLAEQNALNATRAWWRGAFDGTPTKTPGAATLVLLREQAAQKSSAIHGRVIA